MRKASSPAPAATTAALTLPPDADLHDSPGIPQHEFERLLKLAKERDMTEAEFEQAGVDRQRAAQKRKYAIAAGNAGKAASASSREQAITQEIFSPLAKIGVRSQPGRKKGGRTASQMRGRATKAEVHRLATELLGTHLAPRDVSGKVCERLSLSRPQVLRHLRDHPSGHWSKEKVKCAQRMKL